MTAIKESVEESALREIARAIAATCVAAGEREDHSACWRALVSTGFTALREADGDHPAATTTQVAVVVEELAGAVCAAPLVGVLVAGELARMTGLDLDGAVATIGLTADLGALAESAPVLAWDCGEPVDRVLALQQGRVVIVPVTSAGPTQDLSRRATTIDAVTAEAGSAGSLDIASRARLESFARVLLAADTLGAAGAVLTDAVAYAKDREQFGAPIGSFQAVQHLCARAFSELEALRSAVLYAAWTLDADQDHVESALVAKAYAAAAGVAVVEKAVQVFGGVAITWEFAAHRHLRRVLMNAEVLGGRAASSLALLAVVEEAHHGVQ